MNNLHFVLWVIHQNHVCNLSVWVSPSSFMPSAQAKPLQVSSLQQELLQKMAHRTTSAQRLVKRAQIILEALKGTSNTSIAQHLQIDYETVRRWRDRWHAAEPRLQAIEETGKRKLLGQAIEA